MGGHGYGIGSLLLRTRPLAAPDVLSQDGLILNLDAADTDSYSGSGTDFDDLTANGNDFTLVNGPTFDTEKGGNILTDGVNDYIQSKANMVDTGAPMSAFAYVKCTKLDTTQSGGNWLTFVFNKRASAGSIGWQIYFIASLADWTTYGYQALGVSVGSGGSNVGALNGWDEATVTEIHEDVWYYVGLTTEGTSGGRLTMYVNGVAVGSGTLSGNRQLVSQKERAASDGWSANFGMPGHTKNIHEYSKELSAAQVLTNYNAIK